MKYLYILISLAALAFFSLDASATSLVPADTLTGIETDLKDTFDELMDFAYGLMLVFVGGLAAFGMVRGLIKKAAKA